MKEIAVNNLDAMALQYTSQPSHLQKGVRPDERVRDISHPCIDNGDVELPHPWKEMGGTLSICREAAEQGRKALAIQQAQYLQQVHLRPAEGHVRDYVEDRDRIHDCSAALW